MNNFKHRVLRIEPNNTAVQKCAASVCVFSSHSLWTSSSLDVPAGVTQEGHTGFLIHLLSAVRAPSHGVERATEYYSRLYPVLKYVQKLYPVKNCAH